MFSLLASYGARRGGALPGSWFVRALEPLGLRPDTVRQTLFRMTRSGSLRARGVGSYKLYELAPHGRAGTDAGTARLLREPDPEWDGKWVVLSYRFDGEDTELRERTSDLLRLEGFANLSPGTWLHPRDCTERLMPALADSRAMDNVQVFRAERIGGLSDRALLRRHWDLEALGAGYRGFLRRFGPCGRRRWDRRDLSEAVVVRFAFVMSYLTTAWRDPGLPLQLLPHTWPAVRAQALAARLYRILDQPLMAYGDSIVAALDLPAGVAPRGTKSA